MYSIYKYREVSLAASFILMLLYNGITYAQSELFQSNDILEITIQAPFSRVTSSRGDDREYFPATLSYNDAQGDFISTELRMRTRGRSRSRIDTCRFPPLRLNFKKDKLEGTIFDGENILKLVTHCQPQSRYEQYVLLEYLNYRLLNIFTANSFRVRLLKVNYIDSEKNTHPGIKLGFFIEDEDLLAERLDTQKLKIVLLAKMQYNQEALNLVEIFQYAIGNTDWSTIQGPDGEACCHNIVPLSGDDGRVLPVPYDFDATGMVNAPYSVPPPSLNIRNIRQRLYRGFCHPDALLDTNLQKFRDKKDQVISLYQEQDGLTSRNSERALDYLEGFYETINDPAELSKQIIDKCRG